jgi:hypothetical protein
MMKSMSLLFERYITEGKDSFVHKVRSIATRLSVNPDWLMLVFFIETAASVYGKIDHTIKNSIGAGGLIQFLPSTARSLGTTVDKLVHMTATEQLTWVEKYFSPYAGRMHSAADTYLAVLFPAAIGKPDTWVLHASRLPAETVARWNPLFDLDKNGEITVAEVKEKLNEIVKRYA